MIREREIIIGNGPVDYWFFFIMIEIKNHKRICVKVKSRIDLPDEYLLDDSFNGLFKEIATKKKETCPGTIDLIRLLQEKIVVMERGKIHEMVPIFYNRLEKAKYIIKIITSFGVDLVSAKENIELKSRKGDRFTGSEYILASWPNLKDA